MTDILPQLTDADRAALRELAAGLMCVVDVGTFMGESAEIMLDSMAPDGRLMTIDTYRSSPTAVIQYNDHGGVVGHNMNRLARFGGRVTIVAGSSVDVARWVAPKSVDLVFIDAAHDYPSVLADIDAWISKISDGGCMAGHDFDKLMSREPLTEDQLKELSLLDFDRTTGIHYGVHRAVWERFSAFSLATDQTSSIWRAGVSNYRLPQ